MLGKKVPDFTVEATAGPFTLSEHRGHPVVLYFYPKDNTPGCTTEGAQFRDLHDRFAKAGVDVTALAAKLLNDGAKSFVESWNELLGVIASKSESLRKAG